MREELLDLLCCPLCRGELELQAEATAGQEVMSGSLVCLGCGRTYPVEDGIPDLLPEEVVRGRDERWMRAYDRMAKSYYTLMHMLIPALSLWTEPLARSRWVSLLGLRRGDVVLDVATGAGRNLSFLLKRVGREGLVLGMDISKSMLSLAARQARARGWRNVELQRANASYLPYKDEVFDAVFHVGGVNTFEEKARALAEMVRVARPGARLVVVDEGLEPGKRQTFRGRFLLRMNALYASLPPLAELPEGVEEVRVRWGVVPCWPLPMWPFYVLAFRKAVK